LQHSSVKLTSDTYGHLIGEVGKRAAEAASAIAARGKRAVRARSAAVPPAIQAVTTQQE
jgi:hypothetical protein